MLYDGALGHPNTRGFYFFFFYFLCSTTEHLATPTQGDFTFVYFLCSTTEHLATPTQGDLLLFTFCAQRPSTWPPQRKGILLLFTFCAQRPSTWPPQHKGIYFCSLFDVFCPFIFSFFFLFFFTNFLCPNKGLYFSLTSLFSSCLLLLLLSFPLPSSLTITGDFNFLLTNYSRHKQNNGKRNM